MKCIYCGTTLSGIDVCTGCGADVSIQKRVARISNLLYNEGLEKAQIRDLSGAISCLKRSLKFNKENIDARNLLGLCYYETGEVVAALGEWVLSKNTAETDNAASFYISKLQSDKNRLDTISTTIRKYNQALVYCRQDDEDMAVIQLKKVLSQNPNFIKAYHLLSLIYMKRQDYEKARKLLKKAAQIDTTNTTTLRYLHEVEEATGVGTNLSKTSRRFKKVIDAEEKEPAVTGNISYRHGNDLIIQPPTFRDSSSVATFLNIALGFAVGAAIIWFLAIPANTRKINHTASQQVTDANTKLASESAKVSDLEDEIKEYKAQIDDAEQTKSDAQKKADGYEELIKAANLYLEGDQTTAGTALVDIDKEQLDTEAKKLYESIEVNVKSAMYSQLYQEGTVAFAANDFKTAIEKLDKAVKTDDSQYDAWYYLAFAYYNSGDTKNSDETFAAIIVKFPAFESELTQYISDQTVLTRAKTNGVVTTDGDTTTTSTNDLSSLETSTDTANEQTSADTSTSIGVTEENTAASAEQSTWTDQTWVDQSAYTDQNTYTDQSTYTDQTWTDQAYGDASVISEDTVDGTAETIVENSDGTISPDYGTNTGLETIVNTDGYYDAYGNWISN